MMKKLFTVMAAAVMVLSATVGFAAVRIAPQVQEVLNTRGQIDFVGNDSIVVSGEGSYREVALAITDKTYIVQGSDGSRLSFDQLKKGDAVTVYYGPSLTRSIPPQGRATAVIVGDPDESAFYLKAAEVERLADGDIRVLNTNRDSLITIRKGSFANIEKVREGSELLVWYKMMALSMPGQATSLKTILLSEGADLRVQMSAGVISVRGKELSGGTSPFEQNDVVYLPLREVAEQLGYAVRWDVESQTAQLLQGARTAQLSVGSKEYAKMKMRVQLQQVPLLKDGKLFAPVAFFTDVLDLQVQIFRKSV